MLTNEKPRDIINKLSRTTEKKVESNSKRKSKKFLTDKNDFAIIQKLFDKNRQRTLITEQ